MTRQAVIPWSADDTAEALQKQYRAEPEGVVRTRLHALWLLRQPEAGWTPTTVAAALGVHRCTVQQSLRMTATRATLPVLPRCRRPRWKCWWTPSCRITDRATMYREWRTAAQPPRMDRGPRLWPLSRDHGASPTSEVRALPSRCGPVRAERLPAWLRSCGQGAHPRHTAVQRGLGAEGITTLQQGLVRLVQPRDLPVEPGDVPPGEPTDGRADALVQPVPFLDPLIDELPASAQQLLQLLAFLIVLGRTGGRGREHYTGSAGSDLVGGGLTITSLHLFRLRSLSLD